MTLPPPARYAPWTKGFYDVSPNLRPLGTDFGNGSQDACLIQLDSDFARYRVIKEAAYAGDRAKYFGLAELPDAVMLAVADALATHLADDYPAAYRYANRAFECLLTGETICWSPSGVLEGSPYRHLLEALAFQIQPDLAIVVRSPDGSDRIAAVHVCGVSHWRPTEKLGQSFFQTHTVVPGMEKINAAAPRMVDAMIRQGPFVRFVWGVESDDRLNHHPDPPVGWSSEEWLGRLFDRLPFWGRVERQTLLGLPEVDAALFVIHPKTVPGTEILGTERRALLAALHSMSPEARRYKGVDTHFDALVAQL